MAIETPKYKVLKKEGKFELREYATYVTASVDISGVDFDTATNQGFGYIADYIFGNNIKRDNISMTAPVLQEKISSSEKISMTAPVVTSKKGNTYKISFVMPRKYTLKTLPRPIIDKVAFAEVPSYTAAVITFSGFVNENIINQKTEELQKWIRDQKLKATGSSQIARYNPPWTLWFLRKNEIIIEVN